MLPPVLPTGWQQTLVLRENPGQRVVINGYRGPVIAEPTDPSVITLEPNIMCHQRQPSVIRPLRLRLWSTRYALRASSLFDPIDRSRTVPHH